MDIILQIYIPDLEIDPDLRKFGKMSLFPLVRLNFMDRASFYSVIPFLLSGISPKFKFETPKKSIQAQLQHLENSILLNNASKIPKNKAVKKERV